MVGYFVPLAVVVSIGLPNWFESLFFRAPFSWVTAGRREFALAGILTPWLLTTPLPKLARPLTRRLVVLLTITVVLVMTVGTFLGPALIHRQMLSLATKVDEQGVCLQSNGFNCGPASAVTLLRRLGLPAEEGELAILAHTSPISGTPPDVLAAALNQHYGRRGLKAEYRLFDSIENLKHAGSVLAVIKFAFLVDHYVAVLEVRDQEVVVGDPLSGRVVWTHQEFAEKWRRSGVVLTRDQ